MLFYLALAVFSIAIIMFFITGIKHDKKKLKRKAVKVGWLLASMMFLYRYGPLHLIRFLLNIYPFTKSFSNRSFHSQNNRYNTNKKSMTENEAIEILGVSNNPTKDEIQTSFNKLMKKVHPDVGGSKYFTEQIIEARNILLKRRK